MRLLAILSAILAAFFFGGRAAAAVIYDVEIVAEYPHDPEAYTQGLFFKDGAIYESTGLTGKSSLRKARLETGEILQRTELPADVFGEGVAPFGDRIFGLTWRSETGFVFDLKTFKTKRRFSYSGEGWGLTSDGKRLIMSDGTDEIRFLKPSTLAETGRIKVTRAGKPLRNINELEWVDGEIYANIWLTDFVVRIDPSTGNVTGVIDLRPLRAALRDGPPNMEVANGIAWDARGRRLFVTGKNWPKLFEIRLKPRAPAAKQE